MAERGGPWRAALVGLALALCAACSVAVDMPTDLAERTVQADSAPSEIASDAEPTATPPSTATSEPAPEPQPEPDVALFDFPVADGWPESFREYVDFVQQTRGQEFPSVSDVRFADPADLVAEFQGDLFLLNDLDEQTQALVLRLDDVYRALGLADSDFDILDANRNVLGEIAAFYYWQRDEIVFPSPGGIDLDDIPIRDRPVLVHELGHALQADARLPWANAIEDPALSNALLEGEAEWLFDQYLLSLSDAEWQAWNDSLPEAFDSGDLPEILQVEFGSSYVLGSRFFHAQYATGGLQGIDDVFASDVTAVSAQMLLDPWLFDGKPADQETFDYILPVARGTGEYVDIAYDFPTSAVNWHQILAAAMPGPDALRAARGINSYTLPTGWIGIDDRLCFAIEASASPGKGAIVESALRTWSEVEGVRRWFSLTEDGFYVGGCDPGAGNVPTPRATPGEILGEVANVLDVETWAVEQGLDPEAGFCAAWDLIALLDATADDDLDEAYYGWFDALDAENVTTDC